MFLLLMTCNFTKRCRTLHDECNWVNTVFLHWCKTTQIKAETWHFKVVSITSFQTKEQKNVHLSLYQLCGLYNKHKAEKECAVLWLFYSFFYCIFFHCRQTWSAPLEKVLPWEPPELSSGSEVRLRLRYTHKIYIYIKCTHPQIYAHLLLLIQVIILFVLSSCSSSTE